MPRPLRILLIDDDPNTGVVVKDALQEAEGGEAFQVRWARSGKEGLDVLSHSEIDCVLLDYYLGGEDSRDCLRRIQRWHPEVPVIAVTAHGDHWVEAEVRKLGVREFVTKDRKWALDLPAKIRMVLGRPWIDRRSDPRIHTERDVRTISREVRQSYRSEGIFGESLELQEVLRKAENVAPSRVPVAIEGEEGTGKSLLAKAIHRLHAGPDTTLALVDCVARRREVSIRKLLEDEIPRTILLENISRASEELQSDLVAALGCVNEDGPGRVRFIVTTRNLVQAAESGALREDLWDLLCAYRIRIPPLRERIADIPVLIDHFMARFAREEGRLKPGVSIPARNALEQYGWPGNVRQLAHEIRRLVLNGRRSPMVWHRDLSKEIQAPVPRRPRDKWRLGEIMDCVKARAIEERYRQCGHHTGNTAKSLGISRQCFYQIVKRLGIHLPPRHNPTKGPRGKRS